MDDIWGTSLPSDFSFGDPPKEVDAPMSEGGGSRVEAIVIDDDEDMGESPDSIPRKRVKRSLDSDGVDLGQFHEEYNKLQSRLDQMVSDRDSLQDYTSRLELSHLNVQEDLTSLRTESSNQERILNKLRHKVVRLESDLLQARASSSATTPNSDPRGKGKGRARTSTDSTGTGAGSTTVYDSLAQRETELRQALAGWNAERDQVTSVCNQLSLVQAERDSLSERCGKLTSERDLMGTDWKRLKDQLEACKRELKKAEDGRDEALRVVHEGKVALMATKAQKENLEKSLGAANAANVSLKRKRDALEEEEIAGERSKLAQAKKEAQEAKKEVAALLKMKAEAVRAAQQAQWQRGEAESMRDKARADKDRAVEAYNSFKKQFQ